MKTAAQKNSSECAACGRRSPEAHLLGLGLRGSKVTREPERRPLDGRAQGYRARRCLEKMVGANKRGGLLADCRKNIDGAMLRTQLNKEALFEPPEDSRGF